MTTQQIKDQLAQDAQILKDKFIDNAIKAMNDFQMDWNRIMAKKAEVEKEETDKLNVK